MKTNVSLCDLGDLCKLLGALKGNHPLTGRPRPRNRQTSLQQICGGHHHHHQPTRIQRPDRSTPDRERRDGSRTPLRVPLHRHQPARTRGLVFAGQGDGDGASAGGDLGAGGLREFGLFRVINANFNGAFKPNGTDESVFFYQSCRVTPQHLALPITLGLTTFTPTYDCYPFYLCT